MLRCVGFKGSKAAGRLGAARRYNSTISNDGAKNASLKLSSNEDESTPPSLFTTGTSPGTQKSAWQAVDQFMLEYGLAHAQPESIPQTPTPAIEDLPVQFPPFKRIWNAESDSISEMQAEVEPPPRFASFKRLSPLKAQVEINTNQGLHTDVPPEFHTWKRVHLPNPEADSSQPKSRSPPSANYVTPSHLPVSPLMDPSFKAARAKHRLPKAQPVPAALTPFQTQLRNNPYALALATPVRMCNVTRVTLPKFFMQDYNLLSHPNAEKGEGVWWLPRGLMKKGGVEVKEDGENDVDGRKTTEDGTHQEQTKINPGLERDRSLVEKIPNSCSKSTNRLLGPTVYTLLRKEFLYALSNKKKIGYSTSFEKSFIDSQLLNSPRSRNLFNKARWRGDIDEFILELMRRRIEDELCFLLKRQKGYVIGCKSWEDALAKPQIGAYLWTGSEEDVPPPEFATLDVGVNKKQKVPCHNLKFLLGREKLQGLREKFGNRIFENNMLALRHRRATVDLQMRLWKLQGYLAEYRDTTEAREGWI